MSFLSRLLVPLVLILGLSGCSDQSRVEPTTILLDITSVTPAEPTKEEVPLGSMVTLVVTSESGGLLHVHGFEETVDMVAGGTTEATFTANMAGVFEVETHEPDAVWIKLVVS